MNEQIKTFLDAIGSSPNDVVGNTEDDACCCPAQILADMLTNNEDVATRHLELVEKQREEIDALKTIIEYLEHDVANAKVAAMKLSETASERHEQIASLTKVVHGLQEKLHCSRIHELRVPVTNHRVYKENSNLEADLADEKKKNSIYIVSVDPAISEQKQHNEVFVRIVHYAKDRGRAPPDPTTSRGDMRYIHRLVSDYIADCPRG